MKLDVEGARAAIAKLGQADGPGAGGRRQGHDRHRQRDDARRAARHHRAARPRSPRIRHRRLRRRRAAARQRARRTARLLSRRRAAEPRRSVGARLPGGRVQERIRADLHPLDLRPRSQPSVVALRGAGEEGEGVARRAGSRAGRPVDRLFGRPQIRAAGFRGVDRPAPAISPRAAAISTRSSTSSTRRHERLYGVRFHVPVEVVALRAVAVGATPPVEEPRRRRARRLDRGRADRDAQGVVRRRAGSIRRTTIARKLALGAASKGPPSFANTTRPPCAAATILPRSTPTAMC